MILPSASLDGAG